VNLSSQGDLISPAVSPDGRTLAGMTQSGDITLLDTATGRAKRILRGHAPGAAWQTWASNHITQCPSIAFSADSRRLASIGVFDRTARAWDVATGRQTSCIRRLDLGTGTDPIITGIALSPDGRTLAVTQRPGIGAVSLFDLEKETEPESARDTFWGEGDSFTSVAYSPDGRTVVGADFVGHLFLWDAVARKRLPPREAHSNRIYRMAFSPDGKTLATAGPDARVKLWLQRARHVSGLCSRRRPARGRFPGRPYHSLRSHRPGPEVG
jgi:WD40 repeat protein